MWSGARLSTAAGVRRQRVGPVQLEAGQLDGEHVVGRLGRAPPRRSGLPTLPAASARRPVGEQHRREHAHGGRLAVGPGQRRATAGRPAAAARPARRRPRPGRRAAAAATQQRLVGPPARRGDDEVGAGGQLACGRLAERARRTPAARRLRGRALLPGRRCAASTTMQAAPRPRQARWPPRGRRPPARRPRPAATASQLARRASESLAHAPDDPLGVEDRQPRGDAAGRR